MLPASTPCSAPVRRVLPGQKHFHCWPGDMPTFSRRVPPSARAARSSFGKKLCAVHRAQRRRTLGISAWLTSTWYVVTCSASIKACEEGGLWLEALHSLGELAGYRCVGNVFTYSAAISACEKSSAWPAASGLFQQMASCRVRPNVVSYGAAAALRINTVVFSAVIAACARASQRNLVLAMSSEMVTAGVAMDAETCSAIVSVQLLPSTFTLQLLQRSCEDALIHFRS
eukprot:g3583.t1